MQLNLTGKTALVTGATGQLGRVIARTLAACGANLALHSLLWRMQSFNTNGPRYWNKLPRIT